jgi:hypothetical protein
MVQSQPGQTVQRPYLKKIHHKTGGVAQGEGPEGKKGQTKQPKNPLETAQ